MQMPPTACWVELGKAISYDHLPFIRLFSWILYHCGCCLASCVLAFWAPACVCSSCFFFCIGSSRICLPPAFVFLAHYFPRSRMLRPRNFLQHLFLRFCVPSVFCSSSHMCFLPHFSLACLFSPHFQSSRILFPAAFFQNFSLQLFPAPALSRMYFSHLCPGPPFTACSVLPHLSNFFFFLIVCVKCRERGRVQHVGEPQASSRLSWNLSKLGLEVFEESGQPRTSLGQAKSGHSLLMMRSCRVWLWLASERDPDPHLALGRGRRGRRGLGGEWAHPSVGATCPGSSMHAFVPPASLPCGSRLKFCGLFRASGASRTEPDRCLGLLLLK